MSEETPNNSEERLQRYAKERRAQGGDFAMHPATRRMLQGEVARTFAGKNAAAKSRGWFSWLSSWKGPLAIGATAVVVIIGAWVTWNNRLDQNAMQFARAEMPVRKSKLDSTEGTRGFVAAKKELVMADAPVVRAELEKKAAPATPPMTMLATAPAQRSDNDSGKTVVDKITVVDVLTKNSAAFTFREQSSTTSFFANETTLSLAPVVANYSIANAPADAQKQDLRNQQSFNYASAAGQSFTLPGQGAGNSSDAYKNQAGQVLGGSLAYANNDQKQLVESDVQSRAQGGSQLVMQNDALNAPESRARFSRSSAAAPATTPTPANLDRSQEALARNSELSRGSLAASGAVAPVAEDAAPSRYYKANAGVNDASRSRALAPQGSSLAESSPVLNEFVIEQRGTTVRVLDADGSVYDGTVETPPSAGFVPGKDAPDGLVREVIPGDKAETAPRHQELSFRATGSNVTLRQSVVVNGRFTPGTEAARAGRAMPAEANSKLRDFSAHRAVPAASNVFAGQYGAATNATSTIEGTVRIGTTNQQWFRANRRGP